uniref:Putative secreted protein n=1 Tax=Anopheles marajoara TaxID=58244 RepID=A0A2M4CDI0_9DIPT
MSRCVQWMLLLALGSVARRSPRPATPCTSQAKGLPGPYQPALGSVSPGSPSHPTCLKALVQISARRHTTGML